MPRTRPNSTSHRSEPLAPISLPARGERGRSSAMQRLHGEFVGIKTGLRSLTP